MLFRDDLAVEVDRLSKSVALLLVGLQMHIRPAFQTFISQHYQVNPNVHRKNDLKKGGGKKEICCVAHHFISDVTRQMKATLSRTKRRCRCEILTSPGCLPEAHMHNNESRCFKPALHTAALNKSRRQRSTIVKTDKRFLAKGVFVLQKVDRVKSCCFLHRWLLQHPHRKGQRQS